MINTNNSPHSRPTTACESQVDSNPGGDDRRPSDRQHTPDPRQLPRHILVQRRSVRRAKHQRDYHSLGARLMNENTAYQRSRRGAQTGPNPKECDLTSQTIPRSALLGLIAILAIASCGGKSLTSTLSAETPLAPSATAAVGTTNPSGLPSDWSTKAVQAANATIQICAQANTLQPPKCPEQIPTGGEVLSAQWKILDTPLEHAVAIPSQQDPNEGSADPSQVTVFGQYQMSVSYTTAGQAMRPFLDFAGGIAQATMT